MQKTKKPIKHFSTYKEPLTKDGLFENFYRKSYEDFLNNRVRELFEEVFPIEDTNERFVIEFLDCYFLDSKDTPKEAKRKLKDYTIPLNIKLRLHNKVTGTKKEEEITIVEIPLITENGSFIINGIEKTIVSQIVKNTGVRFSSSINSKGVKTFGAQVRPIKGRGVWVIFESDVNGRIFVKLDKNTKKIPITTFIRIFGPETKTGVEKLFADDPKSLDVIKKTFEIDEANIIDDVWLNVYSVMRYSDNISPEKAREGVLTRFSKEYFNMGIHGRTNLNRRSGRGTSPKDVEDKSLKLEDLVFIVKEITRLNNIVGAKEDDVDHLGFRKVRQVGELIAEDFRTGTLMMRKNIRDRMITVDPMKLSLPTEVLNLRTMKNKVKSFFNTNQLTQPLNQMNILSEIEHYRTVSALGMGGVMREHAGVSVRDIHPSHYSRICPLHTPEGPNIGLVLHLALYAKVNDLGLIEAPYAKVVNGKVTNEIVYMIASEEEKYNITSNNFLNEKGEINQNDVSVRVDGNVSIVNKKDVHYVDINISQLLSCSAALIPFVSNNDTARILIACAQVKQCLPCLNPEPPLVATGYEKSVARISGRLVIAKENGVIDYVDANKIIVKTKKSEVVYDLVKYEAVKEKTFSTHQRPVVSLGQKVEKGDILAEVASTADGQFSIGKNLRVGFICYRGLNYEDSIVISKRLLETDALTSINVEEFKVNIRETKLGPEQITADIPNVSEFRLRNLDVDGIVRIGADVSSGDVLVGKLTPKGESQLTPEERLLQSIFGEKARDMKNTSEVMEPGKKGKVVNIVIRDRDSGYALENGVIKQISIFIAELREIQEGDKLTNRHGNKGVISKVLPVEDMPFTDDGEPLDVLLTTLGIPSRKNISQILELHLGQAAQKLGYQIVTSPIATIPDDEIKNELKKAGYKENAKIAVYDGMTGEKFHNDVSVGYMYILKLSHMVKDKLHARSVGRYSLLQQQPLQGKSKFGGFRLGEMEVWSLLGHSSSYILREFLTYKSDDIRGRSLAYSAIIKGDPITKVGTPAAFNVLIYYLRGLGLKISMNVNEDEEVIINDFK